MQETILSESYCYISDLKGKADHSTILAQLFKEFLCNIHQSFSTLVMQLTEYSEQFYTTLASTPEENELNLFHYNQLSNGIINLAHNLEELLDEMRIGVIDPFSQFCENYSTINKKLIDDGNDFLKQIEEQRNTLYQKQQDYLKTSYELEKKKKSTTIKLKAEELFVDYRQELSNVNLLWDVFNERIKHCFEEYDANELGRSSMTSLTSEKFINHLQKMTNKLNNVLNGKQLQQFDKLQLITCKHNSEKQPSLKHIIRNRKFNIFKVTKHDNFISYDDWKNNMNKNHKFDPVNLQKLKLTQTMESQSKQLIEFINLLHGDPKMKQVMNLDFETLFQYREVRLDILEKINTILENASSTQIIIENINNFEGVQRISRSLIINLQKDVSFNVLEFNLLLNFIISYGKREKGQFITIGNVASEKTSLFYERDHWQQLLLHLNEEEKLNQPEVKQKHTATEMLSMLYQKKRKVREAMTQEEKVHYLKVLLNLQKICSIMLKLNIKIDFAGDTIIVLAKMCNIKVSDIVLLLEQFESIKIYMEQQISPKTAQQIQDKQKLIYIFRKSLKYLTVNEQINLISINKEINGLKFYVYRYFLCQNSFSSGLTKKRKALWILSFDPNRIQLDYFKLKEKYSRLAGHKEAQLEQQIAQDVSRSFNSAGVQSRINHLILHNLLKLFAFYNNSIGYTQGMNFVMGFIYMIMENEELTFRCFASLTDKLLKDVLLYDLKYIRVFFYKLDRLLAIFLPKIHQHLKDEKIEAGHYSAPWFISLFTGSYIKNEFSTVLFDIWDLLLTKGWCGYYQILLGIFQTYEEKIISQKFDQLLQFLNNLAKAEFFTQNPDEVASLKTLKYRALKFKVTHKLLGDLEKEYYLVRQKINLLLS